MENTTPLSTEDSFTQDLGARLRETLQKNWDLVAYSTHTGEQVYYREVAVKVLEIHDLLRQAKIKPGEKVAILGHNSPHWATVYIALLAYGAIVVPVPRSLRPKMIYRILEHSAARALFVCEHVWENLNEFYLSYLQLIVGFPNWSILFAKESALRNGGSEQLPKASLSKKKLCEQMESFYIHDSEEPVVLNYTSDTVGFPKGVLLPARSLLANIRYAERVVPLKPKDVIVSYLPFEHIYGQVFDFLYGFLMGAHIHILSSAPTLAALLKAFQSYRPRLILLLPSLFQRIFQSSIPHCANKKVIRSMLRFPVVGDWLQYFFRSRLERTFGGNFISVVIGGYHFNPQIESFLRTIHFRYSVGYGLTESGALVTYKAPGRGTPNSVGKVVDGMELEIQNLDKNGVGNICIRGLNLMLGYHNPFDTNVTSVVSNGWFDTGDLGYLDQNNYLHVKGRSVNALVLPSGHRIYPEELENLMNTMPYVQESLLEERKGELVMLVQPSLLTRRRRQLSEAQLFFEMERNRERLNQRLGASVRVSRIELQYRPFELTTKLSVRRPGAHC